MTQEDPDTAMVLAAGLGLRLRPLTNKLPKPLLELAGRTLLDRALDHLHAFGVSTVVINLHYLGNLIEAHLANRNSPSVVYSHEEDLLLETGGGVTKALPVLGEKSFFVINSDITWTDGSQPALRWLTCSWDSTEMDALLLLHPVEAATGYNGAGDYSIKALDHPGMPAIGQLNRRGDRSSAPFVFTGVQILHPRLFGGAPEGPFSLTQLYDRAEQAGKLYGIVHDGDWHHIGTPSGLIEAEAVIKRGSGQVSSIHSNQSL